MAGLFPTRVTFLPLFLVNKIELISLLLDR